jgi:hypothetical protein
VARRAALCEDQKRNATVSSKLHPPEYGSTISQKLPHHSSRPARATVTAHCTTRLALSHCTGTGQVLNVRFWA